MSLTERQRRRGRESRQNRWTLRVAWNFTPPLGLSRKRSLLNFVFINSLKLENLKRTWVLNVIRIQLKRGMTVMTWSEKVCEFWHFGWLTQKHLNDWQLILAKLESPKTISFKIKTVRMKKTSFTLVRWTVTQCYQITEHSWNIVFNFLSIGVWLITIDIYMFYRRHNLR